MAVPPAVIAGRVMLRDELLGIGRAPAQVTLPRNRRPASRTAKCSDGNAQCNTLDDTSFAELCEMMFSGISPASKD